MANHTCSSKAGAFFPLYYPAERHAHCRTHHRRQKGWSGDRRRVHASVLAAVRDHIDRYQLERGNIDNQKCTHLTAGGSPGNRQLFCLAPAPLRPPLLLQLLQLLHGLQSGRRCRPSQSQDVGDHIRSDMLCRRMIRRKPWKEESDYRAHFL